VRKKKRLVIRGTMKTILLCGAFLDHNEIVKNSRSVIDNAANNFSKKLITGFENCTNTSLHVINCAFIGSYPRYSKKMYYRGLGNVTNNIDDLSFLNVFAIRNIFRYLAIKRCLRKELEKSTDDSIYIVAYSLHSPFIGALQYAKKLNRNIKTCVIIADLPEMMNLENKKSIVKTFLKKIDTKIIYKQLYKIDRYAVLTKQMIEYLKLDRDRCEVIEGIACEADLGNGEKNGQVLNSKRAFLYAGTLNYVYGIMELVEGFRKIEGDDIELWVCGKGEAEDDIKKVTSIDKRIRYFGNLNKLELEILYSTCYALVNPRPRSGDYVKYSFPSKIIEYLSTGKPTIAYYLPGMPDEYKKYIFEIKLNGREGIYETLKKFLNSNYDDALNVASRAKIFLRENKIERLQAKRVLDLMERGNERKDIFN